MEGMNKVILVGRLGHQPELAIDRGGRQFTRLSLATERRWKDNTGKQESRTSWHRVMVWGRTAEVCSQYLKPGAPVMVEGFLNYYEITTPGGDQRNYTSVTAEKVNFLPFHKRHAPEPQAASTMSDEERYAQEEEAFEEESEDEKSKSDSEVLEDEMN